MATGRKHQFAIGLFVLFSVGAAITLVILFGETDALKKTYILKCQMSTVGGPIRKGAPVRMMGIDIGRVESVTMRSGSRSSVVLSLKIFSDYQILDDSLLRVELDGIVGDRILQVYPGADGVALKDGDSIQGEPPISIERTIEQAQKTVFKLDHMIDQMNETLENVNKIIGKPNFIEDIHTTVHQANLATQKVNDLLDEYEKLAAITSQEVDIFFRNFKTAIEPFKNVLRSVQNGEGTIGRLVNDDALIEDFEKVVASARRVVASIQRKPQQIVWGIDDDSKPRVLKIEEIEELIQAGVDSKTIVSQIEACHYFYNVTAQDIIDLKKRGFDDKILEAIVTSR